MSKLVLIVEDEVDLQDIFKLSAGLAGFAAITASDGEEALSILEKHPEICCITLDHCMQPMRGAEFLKKKQEIPAYQNIPVIMCTSYWLEHEDFKEAVEKDWIQAFLRKPFSMFELEEILQELSLG